MISTLTVSYFLASLAVLTQAGLLGLLVLFLLNKISNILGRAFESVWKILKARAMLFSFILALTATLGSLYYSEIAGLTPCELCWFQRIFMYPQALIFYFALVHHDRRVFRYSLPLSLVGTVFAAYNYYLQLFPRLLLICSANEPSCSNTQFFLYGYITISLMSLTAFISLILLAMAGRAKNRGNQAESS